MAFSIHEACSTLSKSMILMKKRFNFRTFSNLPKPNGMTKINRYRDRDFTAWILKSFFNLKSFNSLTSYPGPKYKKVSFSNPGHAHNLAKKLNLTFGTEDFQVVKLTSGTIIKW